VQYLDVVGVESVGENLTRLVYNTDLDRIVVLVEANVSSYLGHSSLLRSER
jgi:hypothetical protein